MEEIKKRIPINADLTIISFLSALQLLKKELKANLRFVILTISIEQLNYFFDIKRFMRRRLNYFGFYFMLLTNIKLFRLLYGMRFINFMIDRDLPKDYWEVSVVKNNTKYTIYSEGP